MLRNLGIRSKLLAVLAVPMLVLIIGAGVVSLQAVNSAKDARQVRAIAEGAQSFSALVSALQAERRVSQARLSGDYTLGGQLKSIRKATDQAAATTDQLTSGIGLAKLSPEAAKALATNLQARARLTAVRKQVDKGTVSTSSVASVFNAAIAEEIQIPARIAGSLSDRSLAVQLRSYSELELAAELATQERDLGRRVISDPSAAAAYTAAVGRENDAVAAYWYDASITDRSRMTRMMDTGAVNKQFNAARASLLGVGSGRPAAVEDQTWVYLSNTHLGTLEALATDVAATAATSASDSARAATNSAWQILGLSLLVLLLPILLALIVARAITRPLRALTDAATQVRDELPRLVESMATPGEAPDDDLIRIPVMSQDEVGKLAVAFNDVNQATMKIAREQAALRGSIAEMFVNVARRNHVLLSRQLSFIDQLERTEENPDTLDDLFKLDHLATRMRRNAESLIVLAGIDSGRRVRQPMALSDVVRTAISEIEKYERVDMALRADPPVVGHVALTTAHLLAELLENATQFSNPDTRVFVVTSYSRRGVRVKISDAGLGMTYDEITDANQRIANPPATDVVGASRLGFFVVGRLARRLDARVTLRAARDRGTVVVIDLPAALFVPGTVAEVTGIDDDDELAASENAENGGKPGEATNGDSGLSSAAAGPAGALPSRAGGPNQPRMPMSSAPPAPSPAKTATPFPYDFGAPVAGTSPVEPAPASASGSGLPQRGIAASSLPQRGSVPSLPRRAASGAVKDLAGTAPVPAPPVELPSAAAPTAPVAEPVAQAPSSHRRPSLFSGFRSQRPTSSAPDPLLSPLPELPAEPAAEVVAEPAAEVVAEVDAASATTEISSVEDVTAELVEAVGSEPVVEDVTPEVADEVAPDYYFTPERVVEDVTPELVDDAGSEPLVEDLTPDVAQDVVSGPVVEDVTPEVVDQVVDEVATEHAPDYFFTPGPVVEDVTPDVAEDIVSGPVVEDVTPELADEVVDEVADEVTDEVTEEDAPVEDVTPEPAPAEEPFVLPAWVPQVSDEVAAPRSTPRFFPIQRRSPVLAEPEVVAEVVAEVAPEPEVVAEVVAEVAPEPEPEVVAEVVAEVAPEPEVAAEVAPEPEPEPEPEVVAEVAPEPEPALEPVADSTEPTVAEPAAPTELPHAAVVERASVFQHFPTRRSRGRHYKSKDEGKPAVEAAPVAPAPVEPAPVEPAPVEPSVLVPVAFAAEPVAPEEVVAEEVVPEEVVPELVVPELVVPELVAPEEVVPELEAVTPEAPAAESAIESAAIEPAAVEPVATEEVAPEPAPVQVFAPPAAAPEPFLSAPVAEPYTEPTEPIAEPEPAPVSSIVDILPGNSSGRGRRLPRLRSRAMKPAAAPLPTRNVSPPAYTQAPAAPPVVPVPVFPSPVGAPVIAPVPVARETSERPAGQAAPAPAFASVGAADSAEIPAAGHFGTRVGDPAPPDEPAGQRGGLFGAPVMAPSGHLQGMSASEFEAQKLRDRSAIASEALSELSRLSGYRPQAVENRGEQSLTRRTPQATPGLDAAPETTTPVPHRERNATDVRSMLSGFRAGVERGRADQGRDADD